MLDHQGPGAPAEAEADLPGQEPQDRQQSPIPQLRRFLLFSKASPWSLGQSTEETSTMDQAPSEPLRRRSSVLELGNPQQASDANRRRATSDSTRPRDVTVRFREPQSLNLIHSTTPSDEEGSLAGSEISDQTRGPNPLKKSRRTRRRATRFALGYPAPQLRTKQRSFLQIRPRILLQLQELGEKRAMPAFDVVPSSLIAGSLIIPKLCKRFPRMFRAKPCLGQDDLLLVRSEQHGLPSPMSSTPSEKAEKDLDDRDVLAVVVTTADHDDDSVEIVFQDGTAWTTTLMANGSYEFTSINEHGEISRARWVRKTVTAPRTTGMAADAASNADAAAAAASSSSPSSSPHHVAQVSPPLFEYKWTFSVMEPCTRRHPIQGVLTTATLDIFDCYTPPSEKGERVAVAVTEENKNLMLATAIWVSLRQKGWPGTAVPKLARVMMSHNPSSGNVVAAAAAAAAAAARCQSPPQVHTLGRGASRSMMGLDAAVAAAAAGAPPPQASSSSSARLKQGIVKRAVSSGGEFMMRRRRRRETYESAEPDIDEAAEDKLRVHEGAPATCRAKIRRLTHRLFHPRSQWVL